MKSRPRSPRKIIDRFLKVTERSPHSDRLLLRLGFFISIGIGVWFIFAINQQYTDIAPTQGGSITEGIVGTQRFINPVLAATRADQDVTALVYSGLLRIDATGSLQNDLAESITLSDDGLVYNIVLRRDVQFHDGTPLTARDVAYTYRLIQDPDLKSPLRGNWTDVVIEEISEYELNVILEEAYAPFVENFTTGIMPAHAWSRLPIEQLPFSQLNTEPIGTGAFKVTGAERNTSGIITHYSLSAHRNVYQNPKLDALELVFFSNEADLLSALELETIDATAYVSPENMTAVLAEEYQLITEPLPRTFGVFFNQNRSPALRDNVVRSALTVMINRDEIIETALYGYGVPISRPTVFESPALELADSDGDTASGTPIEQATAILEAGGWTQTEAGGWEKEIDDTDVMLEVTIRTSNATVFEAMIDSIAAQWESLGVNIITEQFEQTSLTQSVIRPRDFEALLFGLDLSRSYDLYPFWHSSQQSDPGLNIAQYTNVTVDDLLTSARLEPNESERQTILAQASNIISKEKPAIFLAQPSMIYLVKDTITVTPMNNLGRPANRFSNIADWHSESESLWPLFR